VTAGLPPPSRREKVSWAFFDFANSSYTTVIATVVYAPYFVRVVVEPGDSFRGIHEDAWWAGVAVLSNLLVILSAPVVGAMADQAAAKKRYLLVATVTCVLATAALCAWGPGQVLAALLCVLVADIAFSTGENLVAGFLPELATPDEMGRLSAFGWTIGYFGGLLALGVALFMVDSHTRFVPLATALFFAVSALPTFLFLRERATPRPRRGRLLEAAFGELAATWRERRVWRDLFRFLLAILLFQGGVAVVVKFAAIYAKEVVGMEDESIIVMFIALQLAAAGGAIAFGFIQDRVGSRVALLLSILVWIPAVGIAYVSRTAEAFWVAGILSGIAMGSSQSASRAVIGLFCPAGREGAWFGLWGLATKGAAVVGLGFYGLVMVVSGGERRMAILSTLLLFVCGLLLVLRVDMNRGRAAARAAEASPSTPNPLPDSEPAA
jgi:UMF1 family MFS transporter